jgi:methionine-rich copper-binding protein CopC
MLSCQRIDRGSIMIVRRLVLFALALAPFLPTAVLAQEPRVVETQPADKARIESRSDGFFVRFDRPVDHVRSSLVIRRDGKTVQTLHPRFKAAPEVLFARVPALEPGNYALGWTVTALDGVSVISGEIAFSVIGRSTTN